MLEVMFKDLKEKDPALNEKNFLMGMEALKLYLTPACIVPWYHYQFETCRRECQPIDRPRDPSKTSRGCLQQHVLNSGKIKLTPSTPNPTEPAAFPKPGRNSTSSQGYQTSPRKTSKPLSLCDGYRCYCKDGWTDAGF